MGIYLIGIASERSAISTVAALESALASVVFELFPTSGAPCMDVLFLCHLQILPTIVVGLFIFYAFDNIGNLSYMIGKMLYNMDENRKT